MLAQPASPSLARTTAIGHHGRDSRPHASLLGQPPHTTAPPPPTSSFSKAPATPSQSQHPSSVVRACAIRAHRGIDCTNVPAHLPIGRFDPQAMCVYKGVHCHLSDPSPSVLISGKPPAVIPLPCHYGSPSPGHLTIPPPSCAGPKAALSLRATLEANTGALPSLERHRTEAAPPPISPLR
jgi:hypothetical protein